MFTISEAEAAAIRAAFERGGVEGASRELRGFFQGLPDDEATRISAAAIAGWKPKVVPVKPRFRRRVVGSR